MAVGFVVSLLCMLGKENGSSPSRCFAAQATADSEAQAKAAATRPPNGKTVQKQAQAKINPTLLKTVGCSFQNLRK